MSVKFYTPQDLTIPTDLIADVDGTNVYYERIKGGFKFDVITDSDEVALEIAKQVIDVMIRDHDEPQHGVSWRTISIEVDPEPTEWGFYKTVIWKYRVRDSY